MPVRPTTPTALLAALRRLLFATLALGALAAAPLAPAAQAQAVEDGQELADDPAAAAEAVADLTDEELDADAAAGGRPRARRLTGTLPGVSLTASGEDYALPIQLLLLLTVLTLAPAIIILMTSFTRLVVVFSILRTAIGMQQSPPTQVLIGLSLFLTVFIMQPVITEVNENALQPYLDGKMAQEDAMAIAAGPMKAFMLEQTRDKDLVLFMDMAQIEGFTSSDEVPLHVLVPAFVISELRVAFQIGFMLFLPFLLVDLIVASVLMSMGMMMLPPVMISLPIKLLLFVLTDGWYLIVESVVRGYLGA